MSDSRLYPEPPHLTIAVYPDQPESECFAAVGRLIERIGCRPAGVVERAPWGLAFELRSDLAGVSSIVDLGSVEFQNAVAGGDPSARPIRAGYRGKRGDVVVVEYLAAPPGSQHPVAVSTAAGALGIPVELWGKAERGAAAKTARWAVEVLRQITAECAVAYGAIGVEFSLASPQQLASGAGSLPSEVFVSRRFAAPGVQEAFAGDFRGGEIAEWPTGLFYSGWAPFNAKGVTVPPSRARPTKAGALLGRAVQRLR